MNKYIRSLSLFAILFLLALACKKKPIHTPTPPLPTIVDPTPVVTDTTPRPPLQHTKKMTGSYMWYGTRETSGISQELIDTFSINAITDSTISINEKTPEQYAYYSFNDSELVYTNRGRTDTIIFNFSNNTITWQWHYFHPASNSNVREVWRTSIVNNSVNWRSIWNPKLFEVRRWLLTHTYYPTFSISDDTTVVSEVTGNVFSLPGIEWSKCLFESASATHLSYTETYYDHGPGTSTTIGSVYYSATTNAISMYHHDPYIFGATYSYETID